MRSEVKVALIGTLVVIAGAAIWWFSGTDNELDELTLDRRSMEPTPADDASFVRDVVVPPPDAPDDDAPALTARDLTTPAPARRTGPIRPRPGPVETEEPDEGVPPLAVQPGDEADRETAVVPGGPSPAQTTLLDEPIRTEATVADAADSTTAEDSVVKPGVPLDEPPPRVEPPQRREPAFARDTERPGAALGPSRPPKRDTYTIVKGDRLTDIAREEYGDGKFWRAIQAVNPGIDPNRLKIGATIEIPSREEALRLMEPTAVSETRKPAATSGESGRPSAGPTADRATYVIGRGDTLTSIARNVLKDETRWQEIFELNRDKLNSPDILWVGVELRLPPLERKTPQENGEK